ncbi:hypothetical protein GGH96_004264 [Coemansia sp. RSA 1972]|nr:hypothetical protein GGH96_004264 [Coemansia sp. RSA 1972]
MGTRNDGDHASANRLTPRLAQSRHSSTAPRTRSREYEGFFPQHPSRGRSETSMSVIVPDRPVPLGSAPAAMAHKHDRRRDYFTDSTTLRAAMGVAAPRDSGIRYNIREHSSVESTEIELTSSNRMASPTIHHVDKSSAALSGSRRVSGKAARQRRPVASGSDDTDAPLFRRTETGAYLDAGQRGGYGPDSHLPRFMRERLQSIDNVAGNDSRTSGASGDSAAQSPKSVSSSSAMQSMLELEEARLLEAERKSQMKAVDSILTEEQKVAYVGLVYLILVDMQTRLNVQYKESQSSTASFMNFSRRLMRNMYAHICLSPEEQRMIELLPRHKVTIPDMAHSLAAQGDTILVEADQDLAVVHSDDELFSALRASSECRSSTESDRESSLAWFRSKKTPSNSESDIYTQYLMLPNEGAEPEIECRSVPEGVSRRSSVSLDEFEAPICSESADSVSKASSVAGTRACKSSRSSVESTSALFNDVPQTAPLPSTTLSAPGGSQALDLSSKASVDLLNGAALTKIEAEQTLTIDVRATLVLDLFLLLLSDDVYDSRGRYLLRRLAEALNYPWTEVMRCERRVTHQLRLHDYATNVTSATKNAASYAIKDRAKKGKTKRLMIIGLATVGGGLVIGLSAGLLAPAIGAGIGATLGAIGIANTGAFFGSIGGTALITGAATLTGSGLAGSQIVRRTRFAEQFEFIPCINEGQTNLVLTIPGWLDKADNGVYSFSTLDPINGDHCSLLWESEALRRLGSSLRMIVGEVFSITLTQTLQHTVLPSLLGPLSIPMWLAKLGYVLDNPWSNGCELALKAGPIVADLLLQRVQGQRPVTLVGYSIGARLIFYALLELANMNAFGLVGDVYLFGTPVVASEEEWRIAASVVGGRFVNAYSTKDWILSFFYRTTNLGRKSVAGLHPISGVNALENVDVSDDVPGHNAYREVLPILLYNLGVSVTTVELPDLNEKLGDSEEDRAMISELEKAAGMLEEHEKRKKNIWPWQWSLWDSASSASTCQAAPTATHQSASLSAACEETDAAARELAELGIDVKEVPSTLPALVVDRCNSDDK